MDSQLIEMIASLEPMAAIGAKLAGILYDRMSHHSELVSDLIKEVARRNVSEASSSATSATALRNLSHFIVFAGMDCGWIDDLRRASSVRGAAKFAAASVAVGRGIVHAALGHRAVAGVADRENEREEGGRRREG